jgi:hypothetical protein
VLDAPDPLVLIGRELRAQGYGGDIRPALLVRLSMETRLLAMRIGSMPAHVLLLGPSSAGKNWLIIVNCAALPPRAYHAIPAGSAKALIHDHADLRYRLVIFGEADSLPAGEDNPAASAIRNLLTDHHLWYALPERNPHTGTWETIRIDRPGPSVLITTSTRSLGDQFMTRVFTIEVPDDRLYLQHALHVQATLEITALPDPDPAIRAFETFLQARAPWHVVVPFSVELATLVGWAPAGARVLRDFQRLLSLIKAVAIVRHTHRHWENGVMHATLDDYAAIYEIAGETYLASATGAGARIRHVVEAVRRFARIWRMGMR